MTQKIIMFDFDNTIVNSLDYWYFMQNKKMFKIYGKKVDKTFPEKRKGLTNQETAELFVSLVGANKTYLEIWDEWHAYMKYHYINDIKMIKGVKEFLLDLKNKGKKLVLASATEDNLLKTALKHFDIEIFDEVFTEPSLKCGKRDPEFFKKCMEKLNCEADDIFFFEDSVSSLKSALSLGISCCGLIHKYNKTRIKTLGIPVIKNYKKINQLELSNTINEKVIKMINNKEIKIKEINQEDEITLNIWGEERKIQVTSQRILYDATDNNFGKGEPLNEEEIAELNWLIQSDFVNSQKIKESILAYVKHIYDMWNDDLDIDALSSILPPEVEINNIVIDNLREGESMTIAFCGSCLCDEEHGISISFYNRKFVGIGDFMSFEGASYGWDLFKGE